MTEVERLIRASLQAYVDSDRDAIEAIIAPTFRFTSPYDDHIDRATYFERCWPNHEKARSFDVIRVFAEGDAAFVTYEGHGTDGSMNRNTEFMRAKDGQLISVEVFFGRGTES